MNVLFIMTDDLNCDLGAYGHSLVQSPHIDQLAKEGVLFENAYTNFPVCGQSRNSFLSGLYPDQNGVTRLRRLLRDYVPDVVTLPQHFMASGYTAARVGKMYHYDNPRGIGTNSHDDPASWNTRINPIGRDKTEEDIIFSLVPGSFGATLSWLAAEGTDEEQTDGIVATESIKLLEQYAKEGTPFFLGVGFYKPHTPFVAPKQYFDLYNPEDIEVPRVPEDYLSTLPAPTARQLRHWKPQNDLPEETARQAIHAYYATISFLDAQIGRVLQAVEDLGLSDNTIILFSSDHGYHMGEHGYYQKTTPFEAADRVPLIIATPDMPTGGSRTDALIEMIDFYKTLSELAGLPAPPSYVQGKSLVPILKNPDKDHRTSAITQVSGGYTIRTPRYRYTKYPKTEGLNQELYDRLSDPAEMVNLARDANYTDILKRMDTIWETRVAEVQQRPVGLRFIPPEPKDHGYSLDEMLTKDPVKTD